MSTIDTSYQPLNINTTYVPPFNYETYTDVGGYVKYRTVPSYPENKTKKKDTMSNKVNGTNVHYIQSILDDSIKTVKVVYGKVEDIEEALKQERVYTFKTRKTLEVGTVCVVPDRNDEFFTCVTVVEVDEVPDLDADSDINYKWIVSTVDVAGHERNTNEDKEQRKTLRDRLRKQHREAAKRDFLQLEEGGKE